MASRKQVNLCDYKSGLPDFMLDLCDQVIKHDRAGVLRFEQLHRPVDELLQHFPPSGRTLYWAYLDPKRSSHILCKADSQPSRVDPLQKPTSEAVPMTLEQYQQLTLQPNPQVLAAIGRQRAVRLRRQRITSIDQLRMRCQTNHYFLPEKFLRDFFLLLNWTILYRTRSQKALLYLAGVIQYFFEMLGRKNYARRFEEKRMTDMLRLFKYELELKVEAKEWPSIPTEFRQYEHLSDFVPVPESRSQIIREKLKSDKVPVQCPKDCVCLRGSEEVFCEFSLVEGTWITGCPNRSARIECNHSLPEEADRCRNSEIKRKQRKSCRVEGTSSEQCDIEECIIWGIDAFTRKNIYYLLPEKELQDNMLIDNVVMKNRFIDECLLRAMNFLGVEGYDMLKTCDFIIARSSSRKEDNKDANLIWKYEAYVPEDPSKMFKRWHRFYAKRLREAIITSPDKEAFRIHSKGKGARCLQPKGIRSSEFIVEYYGELYEPWRWYERQDFTKRFMKDMKMTDVPDFYNICLEKHKDEPEGYDMLVVDPIHKGNYSSRFSHSCNPNCGTITTVSDGRYYIGMYALRDIEYGEELTFDYCSTTESNYEHKHAICLCGTKECRGNYLQLSNSKSLNTILDKYYCFLERTVVLVRSVETIEEADLEVLARHNLKSNILRGCPPWLVKWASLVMRFLQFESEMQYKSLLKEMMDKRLAQEPLKQGEKAEPNERQIMFAEVGKLELFGGRFQNLVTTIDKLKYYLNSIEDKSPPLKLQPPSAVFDALWQSASEREPSIAEEVKMLFRRYGYLQELRIMEQLTAAIDSYDSYEDKLLLVRYCFLLVSHHLKNNQFNSSINNRLLSDMLYMYAFTHTYFTPHEYEAHSSEEMVISPKEFLNFSSKKEELSRKKDFHDSRKYSSLFVWGQLVAWYKQTIAQPQASLSQDRRGTLSYPTLETIVRSASYPFDGNNRENFMKVIMEKPHSSWPPEKCPWSYKNPKKSYGTMLFESFYDREKLDTISVEGLQLSADHGRKLISAAVQLIDRPFCSKLQLFEQVERLLTKRQPGQIACLFEKFTYAEDDFEESKRPYEHQLVDKRAKKQMRKTVSPT